MIIAQFVPILRNAMFANKDFIRMQRNVYLAQLTVLSALMEKSISASNVRQDTW